LEIGNAFDHCMTLIERKCTLGAELQTPWAETTIPVAQWSPYLERERPKTALHVVDGRPIDMDRALAQLVFPVVEDSIFFLCCLNGKKVDQVSADLNLKSVPYWHRCC
jgi:hypothetical protein